MNRPGWFNEQYCSICGRDQVAPTHVTVLMATDDGSDYPYTQTVLCADCYGEHGFSPAIERNKEIRRNQR